jgi:hypothetical protein
VPACGGCTDNADCCAGTSCVVSPGATRGICGPCGHVAVDGGAGLPDDGGAADSGGSPDGALPPGTTCALYGQICTASSQCCDGVPCDGRCEFPVPR